MVMATAILTEGLALALVSDLALASVMVTVILIMATVILTMVTVILTMVMDMEVITLTTRIMVMPIILPHMEEEREQALCHLHGMKIRARQVRVAEAAHMPLTVVGLPPASAASRRLLNPGEEQQE